jgi:glucose-6-phosphate 1-epimerase
VVTLSAHQISTDIHVKNTTDDKNPGKLAFQCVLHTYYAAEAAKVKVTPLKGLTYINKVKKGTEEIEERDAVDVLSFTDSVYKNAPQEYEIDTGLNKIHLKSRELNDVVVWNPGPEAGAKIADMEDGGW